jgi:nucleotide-binding universal stress UspA family protein
MTETSKTDIQYRKILITTDGSDYSFTAGRHAVYLAKSLGAELIVLNVVDTDIAFHTGIHYSESVAQMDQSGKAAVERIEQFARGQGVSCKGTLLRGEPKSAILQFAADEKVDCIVMGSIGMSAIERVLVGSVSESVMRHAKCPVLLVRS